MNERRFVAERAERWRELGALIDRAQSVGLRRLPGSEVRRLGALYRTASADLAAARTLRCSDDTVRHVNRLCAAAHDLVYSSRRASPAGAVIGAAVDEFPRLVRRTIRWHAAAAALFVLAAVVSYVVFREDPDLADRTFGPLLRARADHAAAAPADARRYLDMRGVFAPFLSWGIIANNVIVTLSIFALGAATIALGALAVIVNGVMVGGLFAIFGDAGVPEVAAAFVVGHGPLELTAIFIAAGAGLRVGASWLVPGRRTRLAAFQGAAREALTFLLGTTGMLVVAGLIEGFVSPSGLPVVVKAAVGATTIGLFAAFVVLGGRGEVPAANG